MDKYLKCIMVVATILGLAFVFAFTNPTEAHPLVDEFSDTVSILDRAIEKAILHKAAHPIFIDDLQEIAENLRELPVQLETLLMSATKQSDKSRPETSKSVNTLTHELNDTIAMLDGAIQRADAGKKAAPEFINDLKLIASDLKALPKYGSVQATSSQEPPVDYLADPLTKSADDFIEKTKEDDDSLWGAIQRVVEGVSELPGLFNEIGDLFKENPAKPEPDTSSKSGLKEKSVTPKEAESAQKQISAQVESTTRKKAEPQKRNSINEKGGWPSFTY